jgi:hypothetical protein
MGYCGYAGKEKLFSIDKNILWWIESNDWQRGLAVA